MGLLNDIQVELLDNGTSLNAVLLKLRFLADRLGSDILEDWVRHELEGYPENSETPPYRKTSVTFSGTFTNGYQQLNDVSIPSYSIKKYAGADWVEYSVREPISVIDDIVARSADSDKNSQFSLNCGNLKLLLQDKIYKGFSVIEVRGIFSIGAFISIQSTVRAKILDLTLKLEREIPDAAGIAIGKNISASPEINSAKVATVANQIINYGTVTNIMNAGNTESMILNISTGSKEEFLSAIQAKGISSDDAVELAEIVATENAEAPDKPLGTRAKEWLARKLDQGAADAWGVGKAVATEVIKEAVKQYYGLK